MRESEIKIYLKTKVFGRAIHSFESIDSTNTYLKSLALNGSEEGTLVIAEEQTAGKGRHGRTWQAEKGMNLTFSVLLKPTLPTEKTGIIPIAAGLAVAEAIQEMSATRPECKWPNDILIDGKKICGILCESVIHENKLNGVIVGIGVNVNQTDFPHELQARATSIALTNHAPVNRAELLAAILQRLEYRNAAVQSQNVEEILDRWKEHSTMLGKQVAVDKQGTVLNGIARDIGADGSLILQTNGKSVAVHSGDVTIVQS